MSFSAIFDPIVRSYFKKKYGGSGGSGGGEFLGYAYGPAILPELPEWDKETFPYCILMHSNSRWFNFPRAVLLLCFPSNNIAADVDSDFSFNAKAAEDMDHHLEFELSTGAWASVDMADDGIWEGDSYSLPFWSNFDLCTEDGARVLAASEPRAVYG